MVPESRQLASQIIAIGHAYMISGCWIFTNDRENTVPERRGVWTCAEGRVPLGPARVQAAAAHHLAQNPFFSFEFAA